MEIRTGLAPLFRPNAFGLARRPAPAPAQPEPSQPDTSQPEPAAAEPPLAADAAPPDLPPAPFPEGPAAARPARRRLPGGGSEALPLRQNLSDALGLWRDCGAKPCRRAKRCLGVRGAACLSENREAAAAALRALGSRPGGA
jgi:hypothetical protein